MNQKGFTLIEICIVIVIVGIMLSGAVQAYSLYDKKRAIEVTDLRMSTIQTALKEFIELNNRLPCSAPYNVEPNNSKYGREEDCSIAPNGTVGAVGIGGRKVRIGMLPVRTLSISDSYIGDGYKNAFVYAVTEELTDSSTYSNGGGAIDVVDNSGVSRLAATTYAQYILLSQGESALGAYSYNGQKIIGCNDDYLESENCDDDAVFIEASYSEADGAMFNDDKISYKNKIGGTTSIPDVLRPAVEGKDYETVVSRDVGKRVVTTTMKADLFASPERQSERSLWHNNRLVVEPEVERERILPSDDGSMLILKKGDVLTFKTWLKKKPRKKDQLVSSLSYNGKELVLVRSKTKPKFDWEKAGVGLSDKAFIFSKKTPDQPSERIMHYLYNDNSKNGDNKKYYSYMSLWGSAE